MSAHRFTPTEADRCLALVRPVAADVRRHYLILRRDLSALRDLALLDDITSDEAVPPVVATRLAELRTCLAELRDVGALLLDPEIGLVSLPGSLPDGRDVQFCWKLGEGRVRFWFPVGGSYADRKPIPISAAAAT